MRTSVSLNEELTSYVAEVSSSAGENDAEAIREALRHAREQDGRVNDLEAERDRLHERVDELESELKHREARVEDLRQQLKEANSKDEKLDELARYVERERTVEQRWREAGIGTRLKWRVFGMPTDETSA